MPKIDVIDTRTLMTKSPFYHPLWLALLLGSALCGACEEKPYRSRHYLELDTMMFNIGTPSQYRKPGIYHDYRESRGVYIISDHNMLVVLSAVCPHDHSGVRYDETTNKFKCPTCLSRFTTDGLRSGKGKAPHSLSRCRIDLVKGTLLVRPSRQFVQEYDQLANPKNTWSSAPSMYLFE